MMKIKKTTILAFLDAVETLAPECRVWLKKDGMQTRAVDTANVAMVSARLPKDAFTEYKEETGIMGFDLSKLKTAIGLMKDGEISLEQKEGVGLLISDGHYNYKNTLLDVNTIRKDASPPAIQLPAAITLNAKEFVEAIKAMALISDKTSISAKEATLSLYAEGDTDNLVKPLKGKAIRNVKETVRSLFSLDYLKDMGKIIKLAQECTVSLNTDHPLKIEFVIDNIEIEYLLAPRIEKE